MSNGMKFLRTDFSGKIKSGGTAMSDIKMIIDELVNSGENPVGMVLTGQMVEILCEDRSAVDIDIKDVADISYPPIEMDYGYICSECKGTVKAGRDTCKHCGVKMDWG